MGLTSREKQQAYRERQAAKGVVPLSVEVPRKVAASIATEAKVRGKTRNEVVAERLSARPKPVAAPLPKDISKEADRIVHLIGKGLRASHDKAATQALSDAMDAIYGLAGMAAHHRSAKKKRRTARR